MIRGFLWAATARRLAGHGPLLVAGLLADVDILYPLYVFSAVMIASLVSGLLIGGRRLRS